MKDNNRLWQDNGKLNERLQELIDLRIRESENKHLQERHFPKETFGGDLQGAKPGVSMTTPTPEMDTMVSFSLRSELGVALAELDTHMNMIIRLKNHLQFDFNNAQDGDNGPTAQEPLDSDNCTYCGVRLGFRHSSNCRIFGTHGVDL